MKTVYLIRHALPDFPGGRRMCLGSADVPLGPAGLAQAARMAGQLPPITAVFSSPLRRTIQTARAIGTPTLLEGLRELDMGQWDGLTFDEIRTRFPELYAARGKDLTLLPPGAEDPAAGAARFRTALELAARTAPGDLAVVTHGGIILAFFQALRDSRRKPDYAQIIPLLWENGQFTLQEEP